VSSDHNVTAYAVRGDDGRTRIAVIEKDDTSGAPVPVRIDVGSASGVAQTMQLTGQSLDSADGVAVQGATVDRHGHLNPHPADFVPYHDGTVQLNVASGSAVIITLGSD
jgi:Glycosyl hydrolase family 79 C-terminal beta domain